MLEKTQEKSSLYELILFYRERLEIAVEFLNKKSKSYKNFHVTAKSGYLDDEGQVSFSFHGIGCTIKVDGISVSIDFDEDGRCDGFNAWIIDSFLDYNKIMRIKYPFISNLRIVKDTLKELEREGLIFSKEFLIMRDMYLLPEDYFSDNPLRWVQETDEVK
jgi:hypothetical protein